MADREPDLTKSQLFLSDMCLGLAERWFRAPAHFEILLVGRGQPPGPR